MSGEWTWTEVDMVDSVAQAYARPSPLAPRPFPETAAHRISEYQSVPHYVLSTYFPGVSCLSALNLSVQGVHFDR